MPQSWLWVKNLEPPHCREQILGVNERAVRPRWFAAVNWIADFGMRNEIQNPQSKIRNHQIVREVEGLTNPIRDRVAEV